ncbi:MAG TPA: hypothetical protein VGD84_16265 [Pseudonocardiaceae bacterium]
MAGRAPRDPAPAGMRDQVVGAAAQAWQQSVVAHYIGRSVRTKVRFDVPGLRADGTPRGQDPVGRFFVKLPVRVLLTVGFLVTAVFVLIWLVIQMVTNSTEINAGVTAWRRKITVIGAAPVAEAVWPGQALARGRGHLWLVTGPSTMAFVRFADGRQDVLWSSAGRPRPTFSPKKSELRWPDDSTIKLAWPRREYPLLRARP